MEAVRSYLVAIVAACMISVLASVLMRGSPLHKVVQLVGGILILLVAVSPLLSLDTEQLATRLEEFCASVEPDTAGMRQDVQSELARHIKQTCETYIEEKAAELGATVQAEVTLTQEEFPVPCGVTILGTLSPEQITALTDYLTNSLNIPSEQQEWKLYGKLD